MNKFIQLLPFMQELFDAPATAMKAAEIAGGILKARSPRLSEIEREMADLPYKLYGYLGHFPPVGDFTGGL